MPWEPEDIVGAVAVWVADDIAISNAANISSHVDRVGGFSAVPPTAGQEATYLTAALNGQPAVHCTSDPRFLTYNATNAVSTASSGHVFQVVAFRTIGAGARASWGSTNTSGSNNAARLWGRINTSGVLLEHQSATVQGQAGPIPVVDQVVLIEWASDSSDYFIRVDGVDAPLTVTGSNSGDWFSTSFTRGNFTIGARKSTSSQEATNVDVGVTIVVDGAISDADRLALYAWVRAKYGIMGPGFPGGWSIGRIRF